MAIDTTYKVTKGSPETLLSNTKINEQDLPLIQRLEIDTAFDPSKNRLDVFYYSLDGRYLSSTIDSRNYSVVKGGSRNVDEIEDITLDPEKDSIRAGYLNGDVNVLYNFINNLFSDRNTQPRLFIESISPDRTEIRALTNDVSDRGVVSFVDTIKSRINDTSYFEDFRLNFSKNQLLIGINIDRIEYKDSQAILIKLYEPLPVNISVKDTFLLEELVGDSVLYEVVTRVSETQEDDRLALRGPNYDIELVEENNNPTSFLNYDELFSYPVTNSFYEVYSLFNEKGAQISIDHTNFEDFIQFSSAEERIRNFYYKASLLEGYRNQIETRNTYTSSLVENIQGIINNFDHYDRYLYYETGSWAWPKSNNTRPFQLHSTGSTEVINWFDSIIQSASLFDSRNIDKLTNSIPSFIREDSNNDPYSLFTDMIGQHFDNLWIYSKAVTDKFDADNRLEFGISKDLVRDAIENFGITLYNNNEALENLFSAFTGESYDTGSEQISSLIVAVEGSGSLSGSVGNEHLQPMPKNSYQKEVYKRIYHNIPLLLKSKGTERGLRALINSFGIPSDILKIRTFGGGRTNVTPFYGPSTEFTSSLGKIRITNTDTVVTGSTLSNFTSVVNKGEDYSRDLHTIEIGFSPSDNLDSFIKSHPSMSAFNLDQYIGDPGLAYSGSYSSLNTLAETVFTSGSAYTGVYDVFDFVRLIKFFDNSIFRIIKDFVPARSNVGTGVIIKPHLLNRSKIKQPEVKWSNQSSPAFNNPSTNLDFTGSFYSTNFSIDGEIDTAFISGSSGLDSEYTTSYTEVYANPSGGFQTLVRNNHDEASYTGELSGSFIRTTTGDLTVGNTFRKLEPQEFSFKYIPRNDFTSPSNVLTDGQGLLAVSNTQQVQSITQDGTGTPVTLELTDPKEYTSRYRITGGPNVDPDGGFSGGVPVVDSGSIVYTTNEVLQNGEGLLLNVTVKFNPWPTLLTSNSGLRGTEIIVDIISGSTVVATDTFDRGLIVGNEGTLTSTLQFTNNTGGPLDGSSVDYSWKVRYSSNYSTFSSINFIDADVIVNPTKQIFDDNAITVWLSEDTTANYTASFIQAMTVPLLSTNNGSMLEYLREAKEVVFEYPAFESTNKYDSTAITESFEGGLSYKANTTIGSNFINLTHATSAPYSASYRQQLPTLGTDSNLEFNFTVDFDSYFSTYLNEERTLANTPFVTASIRNKNTGVVTGSLTYSKKQGQYPEEFNQSLKYINDTGIPLENLEFYYQVNIPTADKGSGNPIVNLKNISVNYRETVDKFIKSNIISSQKLRNTFYLDIGPDLEVSSGSLNYFVPSSDFYKVGFITGKSELFKFNDYASTSNNVDLIRKSNNRLKVDERTYTPTQGSYKGFFLPANYQVILDSINNGVEGLDNRFFAEVQDSNYSSTGWSNGRYAGSKSNNLVKGILVLGQEPALTFQSFNGSQFDSTAIPAKIKTNFSGSETKEGDVEVYYTSYVPQLVGNLTLSDPIGTITNGTVLTANDTTFAVNIINGELLGTAKYSGSVGVVTKNDVVTVDFSLLLQNIEPTTLDAASVTINLKEEDNLFPILQKIYSGSEFTVGSSVNKVFTYDFPPIETQPTILEFIFDSFEDTGGGGGGANITLTINRKQKDSLLPLEFSQQTIFPSSNTGRTLMYVKNKPTLTFSTGYTPLINSKIYRFSNETVYTTNDKGIVINID